jgi:hypothetical protein
MPQALRKKDLTMKPTIEKMEALLRSFCDGNDKAAAIILLTDGENVGSLLHGSGADMVNMTSSISKEDERFCKIMSIGILSYFFTHYNPGFCSTMICDVINHSQWSDESKTAFLYILQDILMKKE